MKRRLKEDREDIPQSERLESSDEKEIESVK